MKLDVPFYKSIKDTDCGPVGLKMVLAFFGEEHSIEELAKEEKQLETGMVWTAGIARAAAKLGFKTECIWLSSFEAAESDIEFYKKHANDKAKIVLKELIDEINKLKIKQTVTDLKFNKLLSKITNNSVPIILLNWNVVRGKEGYQGHFVPVVGYDEENVYVHNPGILNAMAHFPIKRDLFVKAWESEGTDKDVVIMYRK